MYLQHFKVQWHVFFQLLLFVNMSGLTGALSSKPHILGVLGNPLGGRGSMALVFGVLIHILSFSGSKADRWPYLSLRGILSLRGRKKWRQLQQPAQRKCRVVRV